MIHIITLDSSGRFIERRPHYPLRHGRGKWLTPEMSIGDTIYLRPDWPPIGSEDFAQRLREWHIAQSVPMAEKEQ